MTQLCDDPKEFAATALRGFCDAYAELVRPAPGGVLRARASRRGKVALVIGGGSGHYPAFAGYVGAGIADAAVVGEVFASPSSRLVHGVATRAHRGGGVLLGFGNYAGDVLNFGAAAAQLREEGIEVRVLAVTDDIASAAQGDEGRRRGIAGDVSVFKIAGAAAESGMSLDDVYRVGQRANERTRSFGVAFAGCTLPGAQAPLFSVSRGRAAVGLGIHGEPGIEEIPMTTASELAQLLVSRLLDNAPASPGARVAAILNGLGGTKYEELFVLWTSVAEVLRGKGLTIVAPLVGEYVTSLDMKGCSLTLTWLDSELERFWLAPCECAVLRIGRTETSGLEVAAEPEEAGELRVREQGSAESNDSARAIADGFARLAEAMKSAEAELGRIDAEAGDGDHGMGMSRGSAAAAEAAKDAAEAGAGAATALAAGGEAWADRAGGTSGALWGAGLRAASQALDDRRRVTADQVAEGVAKALHAVMARGGAKVGDKTLVDVLAPFEQALSTAIAARTPLYDAWSQALAAADAAAEATRNLEPRVGRARPLAERSKGHRDAGAVSLALAVRTILQCLGDQG